MRHSFRPPLPPILPISTSKTRQQNKTLPHIRAQHFCKTLLCFPFSPFCLQTLEGLLVFHLISAPLHDRNMGREWEEEEQVEPSGMQKPFLHGLEEPLYLSLHPPRQTGGWADMLLCCLCLHLLSLPPPHPTPSLSSSSLPAVPHPSNSAILKHNMCPSGILTSSPREDGGKGGMSPTGESVLGWRKPLIWASVSTCSMPAGLKMPFLFAPNHCTAIMCSINHLSTYLPLLHATFLLHILTALLPKASASRR